MGVLYTAFSFCVRQLFMRGALAGVALFLFIHPYDKYINENNPYNYIIRIITGFLLCNYTGYSSLFIMCTRFTLYTIAGIITAYANGVRKLTP